MPSPQRRTRTLILGGAAVVAIALVARRRLLTWGATPDEVRGGVAGDDLVAEPDLVATRGITLHCEPSAAWPWLAQLGQGRGGFYSYDFLENLVGCDIHSVDHVVPEWQQTRVGDQVRLFPDGGLEVAVADAPRALVLHGMAGAEIPAAPFDFSWAFELRAGTDGTTRLVVRERYRYVHGWVRLVVEPVGVVSFVMSQKMLRGIRDRTEALARA